jgi:hypothetical protein
MTRWNYRLILWNCFYFIHEVFYNERDEICAWSQDPVYPLGDTPEELMEDLRSIMDAFEWPVVMYEDLPEGEPDGKLLEVIRKREEAHESPSELEALQLEEEETLGGNWIRYRRVSGVLH